MLSPATGFMAIRCCYNILRHYCCQSDAAIAYAIYIDATALLAALVAAATAIATQLPAAAHYQPCVMLVTRLQLRQPYEYFATATATLLAIAV